MSSDRKFDRAFEHILNRHDTAFKKLAEKPPKEQKPPAKAEIKESTVSSGDTVPKPIQEGILGVIARKIYDVARGQEGVSQDDFYETLQSEQDNIAREVENLLKSHFGIVITDKPEKLQVLGKEEALPPPPPAKDDLEKATPPPPSNKKEPPMNRTEVPLPPKGKLGPAESRINESLYDMVIKAVVDQAKNGKVDDGEVRRQVKKHIDHIVRDIEQKLSEYDVQVVRLRTGADLRPEQTWDRMSQEDIDKETKDED
jgi:hypothetical protein